jgi:hypothetical protein
MRVTIKMAVTLSFVRLSLPKDDTSREVGKNPQRGLPAVARAKVGYGILDAGYEIADNR